MSSFIGSLKTAEAGQDFDSFNPWTLVGILAAQKKGKRLGIASDAQAGYQAGINSVLISTLPPINRGSEASFQYSTV